MNKKSRNYFYLFCRSIVKLIYGKATVDGIEKLPNEPSIIVANHSQYHGPVIGEIYFPNKKAIWCIGEIMNMKEVPQYAMNDFWPYKPKYIKWFYKILSYIIAPFCSVFFKNASTIAVYKDSRIITTFKETVKELESGSNIIIFPECHEEFNNIVNEFQKNFVDVAKLYYKKTKKEVNFVPMYICAKQKKAYIGNPIKFDSNIQIEEEKNIICDYLKDEITKIAKELPRHRVVPYANVKKKNYPMSK